MSLDILLLEDLAADARQWLAARHQVDYRPELLDDPARLHAQLQQVDALVAPPRLKINGQLLDSAPQLVAVGRIHDGTENIDFEACQKRRVRVIQASSATVRASAEHQLLALLQLFRSGLRPPTGLPGARGLPGREINDSVIALFGMSPPAHVLATMLVPLGVRVVGYDPAVHRNADLWRRLGVQPMAMNEMLEIADAVAMQTIYASRYRGLVGERVLASCKPGQCGPASAGRRCSTSMRWPTPCARAASAPSRWTATMSACTPLIRPCASCRTCRSRRAWRRSRRSHRCVAAGTWSTAFTKR